MLELMNVPAVQAESDGEALCSELNIQKQTYATGSEDMDSLVFGSTRVIKGLNVGDSRQMWMID